MNRILLLLPLMLCTSCMLQQPVRNTSLPDVQDAPAPTRVGVSTATTWFWLWQSGDASVARAQENGGISSINSVTKATRSYLGVVQKHTTTVRGE